MNFSKNACVFVRSAVAISRALGWTIPHVNLCSTRMRTISIWSRIVPFTRLLMQSAFSPNLMNRKTDRSTTRSRRCPRSCHRRLPCSLWVCRHSIRSVNLLATWKKGKGKGKSMAISSSPLKDVQACVGELYETLNGKMLDEQARVNAVSSLLQRNNVSPGQPRVKQKDTQLQFDPPNCLSSIASLQPQTAPRDRGKGNGRGKSRGRGRSQGNTIPATSSQANAPLAKGAG